jgi:hypothetical protein
MFTSLVYGLQGKSVLLKGGQAAGFERAATIAGGSSIDRMRIGFWLRRVPIVLD